MRRWRHSGGKEGHEECFSLGLYDRSGWIRVSPLGLVFRVASAGGTLSGGTLYAVYSVRSAWDTPREHVGNPLPCYKHRLVPKDLMTVSEHAIASLSISLVLDVFIVH